MDLRAYLDEHKIAASVFADRIGVSVTALHRYMNKERWPRADIVRRIVKETGGQVQANDLLADAPEAA
jgi:transcriptional regulator with XRE-family HTH domain